MSSEEAMNRSGITRRDVQSVAICLPSSAVLTGTEDKTYDESDGASAFGVDRDVMARLESALTEEGFTVWRGQENDCDFKAFLAIEVPFFDEYIGVSARAKLSMIATDPRGVVIVEDDCDKCAERKDYAEVEGQRLARGVVASRQLARWMAKRSPAVDDPQEPTPQPAADVAPAPEPIATPADVPPPDQPAREPETSPPPVAKPVHKSRPHRATHIDEAQLREKLAELDRMLAKHLITDDEYREKKKALLDQL